MSFFSLSLSDLSSEVNILNNIASNLPPVQHLLTGVAYLIGLAFIFKALYSLKVYGEARTMMSTNTSIKEPVVFLCVGAIFIYLPTALGIMLRSTFGSANILQYAPVNSNNSTLNQLFGAGSAVGRPLAMIVQTIGLVAFIRGWVLLARSASQGQPPGGTGKGLMHIAGGILAMNIIATLNIVSNTLYGTQ